LRHLVSADLRAACLTRSLLLAPEQLWSSVVLFTFRMSFFSGLTGLFGAAEDPKKRASVSRPPGPLPAPPAIGAHNVRSPPTAAPSGGFFNLPAQSHGSPAGAPGGFSVGGGPAPAYSGFGAPGSTGLPQGSHAVGGRPHAGTGDASMFG